MRNVHLSTSEIKRLDAEIAERKERKRTIQQHGILETSRALDELKHCTFKVSYGGGIRVEPSPGLKALCPQHVGSQDSYELPLDEGFYLYLSDYGLALLAQDRDKQDSRLRFLASRGVPKSAVSYQNDSFGSVHYAEYALEQAIKERAKVLAAIEEGFGS